MSVCVALTDNDEGQAALGAAAEEAVHWGVSLVVVNLTGSDIDRTAIPAELDAEVVVPDARSDRDEVEQVLEALEERQDVTRLVVGVRRRSPIGKAVLGSIAQRLIMEAEIPVLTVKASRP